MAIINPVSDITFTEYSQRLVPTVYKRRPVCISPLNQPKDVLPEWRDSVICAMSSNNLMIDLRTKSKATYTVGDVKYGLNGFLVLSDTYSPRYSHDVFLPRSVGLVLSIVRTGDTDTSPSTSPIGDGDASQSPISFGFSALNELSVYSSSNTLDKAYWKIGVLDLGKQYNIYVGFTTEQHTELPIVVVNGQVMQVSFTFGTQDGTRVYDTVRNIRIGPNDSGSTSYLIGLLAVVKNPSVSQGVALTQNPWCMFSSRLPDVIVPMKSNNWVESNGWVAVPASASLAANLADQSDATLIRASERGAIVRVALEPADTPGVISNHSLTYKASAPRGNLGVIVGVKQSSPAIVTSKQPWRNAPTVAVGIDYNNALAKDLLSAIHVFNGAMVDACQPTQVASLYGSMVFGLDAQSPNIYPTANNSAVEFPAFGLQPTSLSMMHFGKKTGEALNSSIVSCLTYSSDSSVPPYTVIGFQRDDIVNQWRAIFNMNGVSYGTTSASTSANIFAGNTAHMFARVKTGTQLFNLWKNNKHLEQTSANQVGSPSYGTGRRVVLGVPYRGVTRNPYMATYLNCTWGRFISDAEMRELVANPWQIFKPKNNIVRTFVSSKLIAQRNQALTSQLTEYTIDLEPAEAERITDYTKLAVEFETS